MKPDGTDQKILVTDVQVFDYEWSPDSKWVAYARTDGSFASELYVIPAAGGEAKNVTRYATYNAGMTWSGDARTKVDKLAFLSHRRGYTGMYVMSLQKPAIAGAPESKDIDWDDIHKRVVQPAPLPVEEGAISRDGTKIAFRAVTSSGDDLWVASTNGGSLQRLTYNSVKPRQIQWSRYPDLLYFLDGAGSIRTARAGGIMGVPTPVAFKAKMTIRRDEEFSEMYEQSWRALREHFYDAQFHGIDWYTIRDKYRPVVKHVALKEDLYDLVSLMLGELNASHLGIDGLQHAPEEATADLGLIFDEGHRGPGLKIADILKGGPADKRGINLKVGDVIAAIDRVELNDKISISKLLNDKVGEAVTLQVTSNPSADLKDPKAWRRVEIQGAARAEIAKLMYERWVESNAKRVAELSKGKLGYIHIPSMDEAGLDQFVRSLYSDHFDKEAIVLDVRYNSGGYTHEQVLNYLGGKHHTVFRQRNGGEGSVLRSYDRKWTKPLVLLINNRSYSDAEIFPSAFRTLGLGKLVGQATGGLVIGTSMVRLIDGSQFRVPRTGVYTINGINMERQGVAPDVSVDQHPDQLAKGIDPQLDKAVEVVTQDVFAWKKAQSSVAARADVSQPTGSVVTPPSPGVPKK
jgi:tricorn protease